MLIVTCLKILKLGQPSTISTPFFALYMLTGNGKSSISILSQLVQTNIGKDLPVVCQKCHFVQTYNANTRNVCESSRFNPTIYEKGELNPYLQFSIKPGKFSKVKSFEMKPVYLNPSSFESLTVLVNKIEEFQDQKGDKCANIGVDGLPGVRLKRLQTDFVQCETHQKKFKLSDYVECSVHNSGECIIRELIPKKMK